MDTDAIALALTRVGAYWHFTLADTLVARCFIEHFPNDPIYWETCNGAPDRITGIAANVYSFTQRSVNINISTL